MTSLVPQDEFSNALVELEQTQKMCATLMKTPHYARMGEVGIFTILQKAKSVGLNPLDALNGGMYFVNGKVELSANTMNYMIRQKGHSITKDPKSNNNICILHGKRVDNGDTWSSTFSIEEAKRAGIYKNTWEKYPEDMLFARALTRLARQLFPDVTRGCYVEGEISQAMEVESNSQKLSTPKQLTQMEVIDQPIEKITQDQSDELCRVLDECDPKYKERVMNQLAKKYPPIERIEDLTVDLYDKILKLAIKSRDDYQDKLMEYEKVKEEEIEVENE
jgi:hypothetical protein